MARMTDLIAAVRQIGPLELVKRVYRETDEDNVFTNAAAMAYAWLFAVFPFLIFILTLLPYLPSKFTSGAREFIENFMYSSGLTYQVVQPVLETIDHVTHTTHGGLLSFGLIATLYAASGGMNTTMSALDEAFEVVKSRSFIVKRLIAIGLTLFIIACMVVILVAMPLGSIVQSFLTSNFDKLPARLQGWINGPVLVAFSVIRYVVGLTVMQLMIGTLYHLGPSVPHRMRLFSPGAIFAALGWIATGAAIRLYFTQFADYSKTYGAAAGVVVMLMVFYIDAIIVLVGAEIDSEVERCHRDDDGNINCTESAADKPTASTSLPTARGAL